MLSDLKKLTLPEQTRYIPEIHLEADAVLSGRQEIIHVGENESDEALRQHQENERIDSIRERDRILSGTYDI